MTFDDQIGDENLQYDIHREAAKISALSSDKSIRMSVLLVKKYYHLIKDKSQSKLNLLILLWEGLLKKKQKQLKIKGKNKLII